MNGTVVFFRKIGLLAMGLTVLWLAGPPLVAATEIYKYVDARGVLLFTDRPLAGGQYVRLEPDPEMTFPGDTIRYDAWIRRAARRNGLSFALIKAMIKVESNFNPAAVSVAGAKGLMQIMPQNYPSLGITDPFHPGQNIMGGTRYLRQMLDRFDGHLRFALAAYNAGPQAVDRYGRIPPYPETINYVDRVLRYYALYK